MKKQEIVINYQDLFHAVVEISQDNNLHTVDDLTEFLEQNPDTGFFLTKVIRGESHDN